MTSKKKAIPPPDLTRWMISTEAVDKEFESLVTALKKNGLSIEDESVDIMPALGIVCGKAPRHFKERVAHLKHVGNIEEQQDFHLAPPDSNVP